VEEVIYMNLKYKKINRAQIYNSIIIGIFLIVASYYIFGFNMLFISIIILYQLDFLLPFYLFDRLINKLVIYMSGALFILLESILLFFALYGAISPFYIVILIVLGLAIFKTIMFFIQIRVPNFVDDGMINPELQKIYMKKYLINISIFLGTLSAIAILLILFW